MALLGHAAAYDGGVGAGVGNRTVGGLRLVGQRRYGRSRFRNRWQLRERRQRQFHERRRFRSGGWLLGAFLGLIFGIKLFQLNLFRRVAEYQPDREACFSCGRCFSYCPNERVRLDQLQNRY